MYSVICLTSLDKLLPYFVSLSFFYKSPVFLCLNLLHFLFTVSSFYHRHLVNFEYGLREGDPFLTTCESKVMTAHFLRSCYNSNCYSIKVSAVNLSHRFVSKWPFHSGKWLPSWSVNSCELMPGAIPASLYE